MGASGTTTIDFGAFPGKSDASVVITGQAGIVAGSLVEAWIRPVDSADHLADEHKVESFRVVAADIVAGTGFTIYGYNTSQINEPVDAGSNAGAGQQNVQTMRERGGRGTRIYGLWNVAWVWN